MKGDNLNNIGCETTTADVSEQKTEYLKDKIRPLLLSNEFYGLLCMHVVLLLIFQAGIGSGCICGPYYMLLNVCFSVSDGVYI
jgi:hypothetical protein